MYKLDVRHDMKEAMAIERRRQMEEDRKSRIFNAKNRIIGVDVQALEQQMKDKLWMSAREKQREEAFHTDAVRNDKIACMLEAREESDKRSLNKALNGFRQLHQQNDSRREWDLYEPDALKKDKPARISDDDPRCGPSSLQKFQGEDLNNKARRQYQAEQFREWVRQQAEEKKRAEDAQKKADELYFAKQRELDQRTLDLQKAEEECRKRIDTATKDYNKALATELSERDRIRQQQEADDNATEQANHIYGDFLTENPAVAQSAFGPHRVIPDRWKGMSPEQLEEIQRAQEAQQKEAERRRMAEKITDAEWEKQRIAQAKIALLKEKEEEKIKGELQKQLEEENRRLAQEQQSQKDYINQQVYTNEPTAAYFTQWNTTTR